MIIGVAMLMGINAAAQVNWQFQIGGMYSKYCCPVKLL